MWLKAFFTGAPLQHPAVARRTLSTRDSPDLSSLRCSSGSKTPTLKRPSRGRSSSGPNPRTSSVRSLPPQSSRCRHPFSISSVEGTLQFAKLRLVSTPYRIFPSHHRDYSAQRCKRPRGPAQAVGSGRTGPLSGRKIPKTFYKIYSERWDGKRCMLKKSSNRLSH